MSKNTLNPHTGDQANPRKENTGIFCNITCTLMGKKIHVVVKMLGRILEEFSLPTDKPFIQYYDDNKIQIKRKFEITNFGKTELTEEIKKCILEITYLSASKDLKLRFKKGEQK